MKLMNFFFAIFAPLHLMSAPFFYVTNFGSTTVSIVDIATFTTVGYTNDDSFPVGHPIHDISTPNDLKVYRVTQAPDGVFVVNPAISAITAQVATGPFPFGLPQSQAITPNNLKSYVTNRTINQVSIIDNTTDTVTGYVTVGAFPFNQPGAIDITPDGTKAYVGNAPANNVSIIDVATNTVTGYVNPGAFPFSSPSKLIFVGNTKAYVCNLNGNNVSVVDVATDTVTGYITVGAFPFSGPWALILSNSGLFALITNFNSGNVSRVNTLTDTVTQYITGGILSQPEGIDTSNDDALAFASNFNLNTVSIINLSTNSFVGTINPGAFPFNGPFDIEAGNPDIEPPSSTPQAPTSVQGARAEDIFASQIDLIDLLTWQPPIDGSPIVLYRIYRDASLQILAGTVSASGPLEFSDHNREPNSVNTYFIVSVDTTGHISSPVAVTVTWGDP